MNIPSDFIIPEDREKRQPRPVDFTVLDESQMTIAEIFMDYVDGNSDKDMLVVTGWAGCGKTFLISRLVEWLVYSKKMVVAVTAPTNKAVDVLRSMSEIQHRNLTFSTLHKLLGLKENYDFHGRLHFKPDPTENPSIEEYDVLIVDETSMLDNSLFKYIIDTLKKNNLKVVFVGDPAQIPPINSGDAMPFILKFQREYNMQLLQLTHMHRQALENPILRLATHIRENLTEEHTTFNIQTEIHETGGIIAIRKSEKDIIYSICDAYFANDIFKEYSDFMKVTAWRNVTVNAINDKVRRLIYKRSEMPAIMIGEKLLANEPIKCISKMLFSTNAEFEVISYKIENIKVRSVINNKILFVHEIKYYQCIVKGTQKSNVRAFGKPVEIKIIHEDSLHLFNSCMEQTKTEVLKLNNFERIKGWQEYYTLKNTFADVKYNYAITTHKAQGSSYESSMIIDWDILTSNRIIERNRIRYVGLTRPRKYLFLIK